MHCDLHTLGTIHTWVSGDRVEPDKQTNNREESPHQDIGNPFIVKDHMTNAHAAL